MAIIGEFTRTETGFSGRVRTLVLDHQLVLVSLDTGPADNASDYPAYRVHLGDEDGPEVGAAWKRTGQGVVRRQGFWDNRRFELTEALVHQGYHFMLRLLGEASGVV